MLFLLSALCSGERLWASACKHGPTQKSDPSSGMVSQTISSSIPQSTASTEGTLLRRIWFCLSGTGRNQMDLPAGLRKHDHICVSICRAGLPGMPVLKTRPRGRMVLEGVGMVSAYLTHQIQSRAAGSVQMTARARLALIRCGSYLFWLCFVTFPKVP